MDRIKKINFKRFEKTIGENYYIILESLRNDIKLMINKLNNVNDMKEYYDIGHYIKGCGLQINVSELVKIGKSLEEIGKQQIHITKITNEINEIKEMMKKVLDEIDEQIEFINDKCESCSSE